MQLQVHVSKDSMSNVNNLVRSRQLWGNEVYTQDSDLLAVLMHQGFFNQQVRCGADPAPESCPWSLAYTWQGWVWSKDMSSCCCCCIAEEASSAVLFRAE